jgi:hypothetical protein
MEVLPDAFWKVFVDDVVVGPFVWLDGLDMVVNRVATRLMWIRMCAGTLPYIGGENQFAGRKEGLNLASWRSSGRP